MRNIVILNSLHFSYPLPILMRVSYNTLIVKQNTSDYYKYTQNIGIDIIGYGNYHLAHYDRENDSTNVLEIMFPTGITQSKYCRTVC